MWKKRRGRRSFGSSWIPVAHLPSWFINLFSSFPPVVHPFHPYHFTDYSQPFLYLPHSSFHSLLCSSPLGLCISSVSLTPSFPFSTIPPTSPFLCILHPPSSTYPCVAPLPPTLNQSINQTNTLYLSPCGSANCAVALCHCEPTRTRCC